MATSQITLLISLLWIMKPDHSGEFVSPSTIVYTSKDLPLLQRVSTMDEPGNKLPIPDFEDFRPFLETSGVVAQSEWYKYPIESETGLYGFYTLFTPEKKYLGELIVYFPKSINHWRMDDPNQSFIRIVVEGEGIEVIPGLTIGMNREQLYTLLGEPLYQSENCAMYMDQSGTCISVNLNEEQVTNIDCGLFSPTYLDSIKSRTAGCD